MEDTQAKGADRSGRSNPTDVVRPLLSRFLARAAQRIKAVAGGADWLARRPALTRASAHVSVLVLAVVVVLLGGAGGSGLLAAVGGLGDGASGAPAGATSPDDGLLAAGGEPLQPGTSGLQDDSVLRVAVPHTTFPDRPREEVVTYVVVPGDTVWDIAVWHGISASTIYWANSETLHDNPHLLPIGTVLNILPVSGVYHRVEQGDTVEALADKYEADVDAFYNEWNNIEPGEPLRVGQDLVVPGGSRDYIVWQPDWDVRYGSGACPDVGSARGGGGYSFAWPTDSRRISGWTFHDPRNPPHSGLDIGVRIGDPIYAADGGTVIYRGWSGGYGNLVVLYHGRGYQTFYAHLDDIWVDCGQVVAQGDAIGPGGTTGYSTGPHLHFEIRLDNVPIDPQGKLPLS
jgi:LysM repeat protein